MTSEEAILAEVAEARLPPAEIHRITYSIHAPSANEFWAAMARTRAPLVLLQHSMGEEWPPLAERVRAGLLERLGEGPVHVPMTALLSLIRMGE